MPAKKTAKKVSKKVAPRRVRVPRPPEPYVRNYRREMLWVACRQLASEFGSEGIKKWAHSVDPDGVDFGTDFDEYMETAAASAFAQQLADED